jgi:voltage-gated potassium channel
MADSRTAHLKLALCMLVVIILLSTAGYMLIEGWSPLDAFYMTFITVSTVGFKEVRDLSPAGKVLTILVILGGTGTAGYSIGLIVQAFMGGEVRRLLGRNRLSGEIAKMHDHFIVCGLGRMGRLLCEELSQAGVRFVIVEKSPDMLGQFDGRGWPYIVGDAADSAVLEAAGIGRARGLASVVGEDADNVFVTLTARQLNKDLKIISRAEQTETVSKLHTAGADRVVSPHMIGATRIAQLIVRPDLVEFVDVVTSSGPTEFQMDELKLGPDSRLAGRTIGESHIRQEFSSTIVAIKKQDGSTVFHPTADVRLELGDVLIVIGPRGAPRRFAERVGIEQAPSGPAAGKPR